MKGILFLSHVYRSFLLSLLCSCVAIVAASGEAVSGTNAHAALDASPPAGDAARSAVVRGRVRAADGPLLENANVLLEGTRFGAASGPDGTFEIRAIPPGVYRVRVTMIGHRPFVQEIVAGSGDVL
ncbi:MAG: carboxypeptidase-like regulatory domain-containing protein, partial [Candidatus Eisenbacteria bacterium]|nr:carboxypeptidase-like regulatory domain-containing protein [Candidatus Eisenbacteria bacterium]